MLLPTNVIIMKYQNLKIYILVHYTIENFFLQTPATNKSGKEQTCT